MTTIEEIGRVVPIRSNWMVTLGAVKQATAHEDARIGERGAWISGSPRLAVQEADANLGHPATIA